MAASRADLAFLYRRAAFGARPAELDAAVAAGYEAAVDGLLGARALGGDGTAAEPPPVLASPLPPPPAAGPGRGRPRGARGADQRPGP
ncbi:DUF1800 domain-containing protein, partial [Frankia sp. CN7]|nr:DUF1800 domain-containing protein [Frankia nepalensis]